MTLKIERELVEARCAAAAAGDEVFVRSCQLCGIASAMTAVPYTTEVEEGWSDAERIAYLEGLIHDRGTSSEDARKIRLYLAWRGHARSQYVLGYDFHFGSGIACDYALARYWYGLAADQDNPHAQNNLANLLVDGLGGETDAPRATSLYERSTALGNLIAAGNLGMQLVEGGGVARDYRRAATFLKMYLAEYPYSGRHHFLLAECYRHGAGGRSSRILARHHYREASDFGLSLARKALRKFARKCRPPKMIGA